MTPDANQRLPQHNADHMPVRTYKEISGAPEHISFASHHQAACWTPIEATTAWYKVLDLEGPIISRLHQTHTLWPRRHGEPPTIGPLEHNDEHGWSTSAQPTGRQRLINMDKPATYRGTGHDARRSTFKLYQNMIRKSVTHSFSRNRNGCWNTMPSTIYLQHISVGTKLYNQQRTFQSVWRTDNARYQSAVSQGHDAGRQPILRLPRHDA